MLSLTLHFEYRKEGEMALRHQRSPDVDFTFEQKGRRKPDYVYKLIETLLPDSVSNGSMLELWYGFPFLLFLPSWPCVQY